MSPGLHMAYDLLLCLFSQNTDGNKNGGQSWGFWIEIDFFKLFFITFQFLNFVFWRKQLKIAMQPFSHV